MNPPTECTPEISLKDQGAATAELNEERKRIGLEVWQLETKSGVSASAFFAWKAGKRAPVLSCMVAIAQTLGYATVLRHSSGREYRIMTAKAVMTHINAERRARGWTFADCERESGISSATYYPLAQGKRDPRVSTMVAISGALGFELILRSMN